MVQRLSPVLVAAIAAVAAMAPLAACNALTGAGDLEARDCPECISATQEGGPGTDGGADVVAPRLDAGSDVLAPPKPGGFLDTTFGTGGAALSALLDVATSVAVRADGKIYVGGSFGGALAVVRFNADGTLDTSFDGTGRVVAPTLTSSLAQSIAVDGQGRVVAAGYAVSTDPMTLVSMTYAYVVRIRDSGIDGAFGNIGRRVTTNDGEIANAVVIANAAGDILLGGRAPTTPTAAALWQLTSSGAFVGSRVDLAYGVGEAASITAMTAGPAQVFAVGLTANATTGNDYGAARLVGAALDPTFDGDGKASVALGSSTDLATGVARLSDGSVVIAGTTAVPFTTSNRRSPQCGLARLQPNGALAPAFGTSGKAVVSLEQAGVVYENGNDHIGGVVADGRDNVVVVGWSDEKIKPLPNHRRSSLIRVRPDGQLDPLFGTGGKLSFSFEPGMDSRAVAIATQPDGKLVAVGAASTGIGLVRVIP